MSSAPKSDAITNERSAIANALLPIAIGALYIAFAVVHATVVNTDVTRHDQSTYLNAARFLLQSHYEAPTNRMQMPGYVYLQSLFLDPTADDAHAFFRGKIVNIGLSVVLLAVLHLFFRRTLPRLEAGILTLTTAFTVFVFRAGYFQTELLFYTCAFFGFVALCRFWEKPAPASAIVAGLFETAAYLTKGSVPPGMILFVLLFIAREARDAWRSGLWKTFARNLFSLALMPIAFVLPMLPYLRTSKALYGDYFHNLSSTYVIWFDTWEDFVATERVLGDWHGWHALPPDQQPTHSALVYLHTHSIGQIVIREVLGLGEVLGNVIIGHGYAEYLFIYLGFMALAVGLFRTPIRALRAIDSHDDAAFAIPFAIVYALLFGFYAPIAAGNRFILMLFLPVLYTLLRHGAASKPSVTVSGRTIRWETLNRFVLVALVLHVIFVLPATITRIYAGG